MRIETERLILRSFTINDAKDMLAYLREIDINCFMCMKIDDMEKARKEAIERSNDAELYLAIELKENNTVIGEICAHAESNAPDNDGDLDTYSPFWMLKKEYQGKGYMYEAACAYYNYLFEQKGARRIYVYTEDYNLACQRLSEKLGMRKEGLFQEFVSFVKDANGEPIYENTYQYAILKKEWKQG